MPNIRFFTSESYESVDINNRSIYLHDIDSPETIKDIKVFLASNKTNKSVVSMNELFSPYTTNKSGFLMPVANFDDRSGSYTFDEYSRQEILSTDVASGFNYGICPTFEGDEQIYDKENIDNINSIAFRNPMMIAGFGYTPEGMPTPNRLDQRQHDQSGSYEPTTSQSGSDIVNFADNVRHRSDLWNAGPLDVRWDKYKNMYVAAPEMFVGYALCDIPACSGRYAEAKVSGYPFFKTFTSGEIEVAIGRYDDYRVPSGVDSNGQGYSKQKLLIINRSVSMDIASGALVVATRTNNGEYFPIFCDCAADIL